MTLIDPNCEACGWIAAAIAMLSFGSYAVPMKFSQIGKNADPLVFQTYMSAVVFASSFLLILLLPAVDFEFSPWGIVSAACWIPGALAIIYAVQNAGLALAIGISNSLAVLVAYVWGIFMFDELIKSLFYSVLAIMLLICGISGMAYCSSFEEQKEQHYAMVDYDDDNYDFPTDFVYPYDDDGNDVQPILGNNTKLTNMKSLEIVGERRGPRQQTDICRCPCCGIQLSKRILGIFAAIFQGAWGGSVLVPMHFSSHAGIGFSPSFGIGCLIVTCALWIVRYLYNTVFYGSCKDAYENLPEFHLSTMLLPASLSSILWNIGNILSMISVETLGQGFGYSIIQLSMLVSGLFGILLFSEISGAKLIGGWFLSAMLAVAGMLFLSYEHIAAVSTTIKTMSP